MFPLSPPVRLWEAVLYFLTWYDTRSGLHLKRHSLKTPTSPTSLSPLCSFVVFCGHEAAEQKMWAVLSALGPWSETGWAQSGWTQSTYRSALACLRGTGPVAHPLLEVKASPLCHLLFPHLWAYSLRQSSGCHGDHWSLSPSLSGTFSRTLLFIYFTLHF